MYNRILKRPMFKRGGSSHQAQGTGITSPFDTPRKKYELGAWGEWEERVREQTQDPRGDLSYGVQGFSALANPYKESGEAKMLSEMLWEGAQGVRGSREKARALEQKGEMAILEGQAGRMLTDEERAWKEAQAEIEHQQKLKEIAEAGKYKKNTYMDEHPGKTYDKKIKKWTDWSKIYQGQAGHETVSKNIESFAQADMIVKKQQVDDYRAGKTSLAQAVPPEAFKDDGTIDISILTGSVVYYDPISKSWFTVNNAGTENATVISAESYIDGWHNLDQNPQSKNENKNKKLNKKENEQKSATELADPYTQEDWEESAAEGTEKLLDRFKLKGDITEGQSNRYIENNKDTELSELQNWWQNTIANDKG